tara:strand:+ start:274 stop:936 length:663 start_codon:yes stop_codon:yes gene_type:complete
LKKNIKIAASILSADFSNLGKEVADVVKAGADLIHIDVMDGSFVPNITIGSSVVSSIRKYTKKPFDVHLMVENPANHIDDFVKAGSDFITIHYEADKHPIRTLEYIKNKGIKSGISINPGSSENCLDYLLDYCDLILIMLVNPGYGGQKTIESQIEKVRRVKEKIVKSNKNILLEVDGGINKNNISKLIDAGADLFVAGNSIFKNGQKYYKKNITLLKTI